MFYLLSGDGEGSVEPLLERVARLEDGGQQKVEQSPELGQLVLQGRSRQQETVVRSVESVQDLGEFAVVILHAMALVDDHVLPTVFRQHGLEFPDQKFY